MGYLVAAPMVYLKVPDVAGALVSYTFYAGAVVPDNVDQASLQHHLDSGLVVSDSDPVAEVAAVPAGTPIPGEPPNVPVSEAVLTEAPEDRVSRLRGELGSDGKPSANAPKADWVKYAASQGVSPEEAEASSKADLQKQFG